jgi:hypothetical protein
MYFFIINYFCLGAEYPNVAIILDDLFGSLIQTNACVYGGGTVVSSAKQLKLESKNTSKDAINRDCIGLINRVFALIKVIMGINSSFYHYCKLHP